LPLVAIVAAALLGALAMSALVVASLAPAADLSLSLTKIDNPPVHVVPLGSLQAITLKRHRDDVTLQGTASGGTTVTARINGDVVAAQRVGPDATFRMDHVPLPQGWSTLIMEASVWHGAHHSVNHATYTVENPDPPPFTKVVLTPKTRDNGNLELAGTGPHNGTVLLYDSVQSKNDKEPAAAVELARAHTGDDGSFDVRISLAAGKHELWAALPHCEQSRCSSKPAKPLSSVAAIVVETALFYTALGLAFDVAIVRDAKQARFRLRDVPVLSGVPALSRAGTIIVASAGVALNGILSGQLQNIVTSTITSVFHQAAVGQ